MYDWVVQIFFYIILYCYYCTVLYHMIMNGWAISSVINNVRSSKYCLQHRQLTIRCCWFQWAPLFFSLAQNITCFLRDSSATCNNVCTELCKGKSIPWSLIRWSDILWYSTWQCPNAVGSWHKYALILFNSKEAKHRFKYNITRLLQPQYL